MNNKLGIVFVIIFVGLCAFATGYWLGTEKTLNQLDSDFKSSQQQMNTTSSFPSEDRSILTTSKNLQNKGSSESKQSIPSVDDNDQVDVQEIKNESGLLTLANNAGVIEMMMFLEKIGLSENEDDIDQFGPTIEAIVDAVSENPDKMQLLIDYFVDSDDASKAPYYITSVLRAVNIQDKEFVINNMVGRLSSQGTPSAHKKLLHLVSSTGDFHDNQQIIDAVKNIALYSPASGNNRTYALDLLMPYQLSADEKRQVVNDLSFSLEQAPNEEISYMIENIIRFSDQEARTKLATNYLSDTQIFSKRVAILSTMHNGSVAPNEELKAKLFQIAQNPNDPLNKHAKDTLIYVFDISNNEYRRLKPGG